MNYQNDLEAILKQMKEPKSLCLHSCCAPCSSYVLEYLCTYFHVTVFYCNPNITEKEEYEKRAEEQKRLIHEMNRDGLCRYPADFAEGHYRPAEFFELAKGMEEANEGGGRCFACYENRLQKTAEYAENHGFDYFTTTLTISPLKNAQRINEIGMKVAEEVKTSWLPSDFKKKNGYLRSLELSRRYNLYRQDYCGCIYSKRKCEK